MEGASGAKVGNGTFMLIGFFIKDSGCMLETLAVGTMSSTELFVGGNTDVFESGTFVEGFDNESRCVPVGPTVGKIVVGLTNLESKAAPQVLV